jgi:hypothetical protein
LKVDRYAKDLSKKLDNFSNGNGNYDDDGYVLYKHDDEYYLDRGSEPPRFAYYRHVRAEEWKALGHKPWDHEYDNRITQDELDFILKRVLRIPPEERYQREKAHYYFHELYIEGRRECNPVLGGCTPNCRFYHEYGRIEDEEVREEHNKLVERHRQENSIVDPPSESELLRLVKIHSFD